MQAAPGTWSVAVVANTSLGMSNNGSSIVATYLLPEPATMAILGCGAVAIFLRRRRRVA